MTKQEGIGSHKTAIYQDDNGFLCVRYHSTEVFRMRRNGNTAEIEMRTGGHMSNTTKKRINQACAVYHIPFKVIQRSFDWFLLHDNGDMTDFKDGASMLVKVSQ